ncbi:MAG: glycosyltransferase family 4 protein, partial [Caldilineaceae bacterium]|nr:glycosyltransferase family 4 protein [Caldilineaceae bacterium]
MYTEGLARSLVGNGHQVSVFLPAAAGECTEPHSIADGVLIWRAPASPASQSTNPVRQFRGTFRDRAIEADFVEFLQATRPEIIHFQHVQGVSAKLLELAGDLPKVVTLHDYWYFCANSQLIRPDRQPCAGPSAGCRNCVDCATSRADLGWLRAVRPLVALPLAYRNRYLRDRMAAVDRFIAPSEFLRRQYIGQGFPAERIVMLENGIETSRLARHSTARLAEPPARPHFGFLGSLAWQKGVHILIDAFNSLPDQAALTIYGSESAFPDYVSELKAQA